MTIRQQIKLDTSFSVSVPNARLIELELVDTDEKHLDFLSCKITNSTNYAPPKVYLIEGGGVSNIIRIEFDQNIPLSTALEMIITAVQPTVEEMIVKRPLLSDNMVKTVKKSPFALSAFLLKSVKLSVISFAVFSVLFYIISDTRTGDMLSKFNAATGAKVLEDFDIRIATNSHALYDSTKFAQAILLYKTILGTEAAMNLKDLYRFAGNVKRSDDKTGFFVMADVAKNKNGAILMLSNDEAIDHCEILGGEVLTRKEMRFLADLYAGAENRAWPIRRRGHIREWTIEGAWWWSWVYIKESDLKEDDKDIKNGFMRQKDSKDEAFRCGFSAKFYMDDE